MRRVMGRKNPSREISWDVLAILRGSGIGELCLQPIAAGKTAVHRLPCHEHARCCREIAGICRESDSNAHAQAAGRASGVGKAARSVPGTGGALRVLAGGGPKL